MSDCSEISRIAFAGTRRLFKNYSHVCVTVFTGSSFRSCPIAALLPGFLAFPAQLEPWNLPA